MELHGTLIIEAQIEYQIDIYEFTITFVGISSSIIIHQMFMSNCLHSVNEFPIDTKHKAVKPFTNCHP